MRRCTSSALAQIMLSKLAWFVVVEMLSLIIVIGSALGTVMFIQFIDAILRWCVLTQPTDLWVCLCDRLVIFVMTSRLLLAIKMHFNIMRVAVIVGTWLAAAYAVANQIALLLFVLA